jgi:hypothetical protein
MQCTNHAFVINSGYAETIKVMENTRNGTMNTQSNNNFNATEFCSQKLWEMVSGNHNSTSHAELEAAVAELADRRHYLAELEQLGVFGERRN